MDYDEWLEKYKPDTDNPIEIYEITQEFIDNHPNRIWTYCSGGDGDYIVSGVGYVNRVHYYVSEYPYEGKDGSFILIFLEEDETEE